MQRKLLSRSELTPVTKTYVSSRTDALCPRVLELDVEEMAHERLDFTAITSTRLHRVDFGKEIGLDEVVFDLAATLCGNLSLIV